MIFIIKYAGNNITIKCIGIYFTKRSIEYENTKKNTLEMILL